MKRRNTFIANASSSGKLMVGGTFFTDSDAEELKEYQDRKAGKLKSKDGKRVLELTDNMAIKMSELMAKKKAGFQFGATAMSYIEDKWRADKYGYKEPLVTDVLMKGLMCEQDTMRLAQSQIPSRQFRVKCKERKTTKLYTGQCDVDLDMDDMIEDEKTSWSLKTFFNTKEPPELYYAQGQVYMKLYGRSRFRLVYALVDTPDFLIERELRKYKFMFSPDGDTDNRYYREIEEQIYHNHKVEDRIPPHERIKYFEFERNDEYLKELDKRVILAQKIYKTLTLGGMGLVGNLTARIKSA